MTNSEMKRLLNRGPYINCGRFGVMGGGFSSGSETSRTYVWTFTPLYSCTGIQLKFANWIIGSGGTPQEAIGLNDITVKTSLNNGTTTRQSFFNSGLASSLLAPGAGVISDPNWMNFTGGVTCTLRVVVSVDTIGKKWPLGPLCQFSETGDLLMSGTVDDAASIGFGPIEMTAYPLGARTTKSVLIVTDSLGVGGGETQDYGWPRRGLDAAGIAWSRSGMGSNTLAKTMDGTNAFALAHMFESKADIILCTLGGNDLIPKVIGGTITTLAGAQSYLAPYLTAISSLCQNSGKELWTTTLTPGTSPGAPIDSAGIILRGQINDWYRSDAYKKLYNVTKVLDVAASTETAVNNNVWRSSTQQGDGVHLSTTGATRVGPEMIIASDFLL